MFNTRMAIVHPEIASALCRCREVNRDHEGLFSRNAARTFWHADRRHQTSDRELRLSGRSDDQTSSVRESKVIGHLLAVGWASVRVARHRFVSERLRRRLAAIATLVSGHDMTGHLILQDGSRALLQQNRFTR